MATIAETTKQWSYDGNAKGLPAGIRDFDTDGKVLPIISAVTPASPVAGSMYFNNATNALYIYNGSAWKSTTLA